MSPGKTEDLIRIAKKEGEPVRQVLDRMLVEHHGQSTKAGGMTISVLGEPAQGWYEPDVFGTLKWKDPEENENQHIEVFIADSEDGRLIPCLYVEATIIDERGNNIGTRRQFMYWSPTSYHYGANWPIPGEGPYNIRVHVGMPEFPRHNKELGNRFDRAVNVEFVDIYLKPGKEG